MATRHLDPPAQKTRSQRRLALRVVAAPAAAAPSRRIDFRRPLITRLSALGAVAVLGGAVAAGFWFGAGAGPDIALPLSGLLCVAILCARLSRSPRAEGAFWLASMSTSACAAVLSGLLTLDSMNAVNPVAVVAFNAMLGFLLIGLMCMWTPARRARPETQDQGSGQVQQLLDMFEPVPTRRRKGSR